MLSPGLCTPVMVVLAHPRTGSLCHRMAYRAVEAITATGVEATLHDLYAEGFDPVLLPEEAWQANLADSELLADSPDRGRSRIGVADPMVSRHRTEFKRARGLVVVHPDWWGKPPAILSGWLDRVLVPVCAEAAADENPEESPGDRGLQRVLVINTADAGVSDDADPLGMVWREGVGRRLPTTQLERMALRGVTDASDEQLDRWLAAAERAARWLAGGQR